MAREKTEKDDRPKFSPSRGLSAKRESRYVDFKGSLDLGEPHSWCEIIKDIVAMANSGGGVILIGLDNGGRPTGFDPTPILDLDPATVSDKIRRYTGLDFDDFEITREEKNGQPIGTLCVGPVSVPIVFTSPGTYQVGDGKQKTAFSSGTVYFRHGAKSEPGTTEDIRRVIERQLDSIRRSWLRGVRKVVQSPPGHEIVALAPGTEVIETKSAQAIAIRLTDDPSAPAYRKLNPDDTHPYRQTELVRVVNQRLKGSIEINSYDIQVVKQVYQIMDNPEFVYKPRFGSAQYSEAFAQWIVNEYQRDSGFFAKAREEAYKRRH